MSEKQNLCANSRRCRACMKGEGRSSAVFEYLFDERQPIQRKEEEIRCTDDWGYRHLCIRIRKSTKGSDRIDDISSFGKDARSVENGNDDSRSLVDDGGNENEIRKRNELEKEIWYDIHNAVGNLDSLESDMYHVRCIVGPMLGSQYVLPQKIVQLTTKESELYGASKGVLMPDATRLPENQKDFPFPEYLLKGKNGVPEIPNDAEKIDLKTISIELKPKFGSVNACPTALPQHVELKRSSSRYALHQYLKFNEDKISKISMYDPIDLFSENKERMEYALKALFQNPQNNLRVFVCGNPLDYGPAGLQENFQSSFNPKNHGRKRIENLLNYTSSIAGFKSPDDFISAVYSILNQEGVLSKILNMQCMCPYDIEGVARLYSYIIGEKSEEDLLEIEYHSSNNGVDNEAVLQWKSAVKKLLLMPRADALKILRSHCLASTAKDCSVFVTFERYEFESSKLHYPYICAASEENGSPKITFHRKQSLQGDGCGIVQLPESHCILRYRVAVVDLDRKPVKKIDDHWNLDRRIMETHIATTSRIFD